METNFDNNMDSTNETNKPANFWHGSGAFFLFFVVIVALLVGISYLVKWLF